MGVSIFPWIDDNVMSYEAFVSEPVKQNIFAFLFAHISQKMFNVQISMLCDAK